MADRPLLLFPIPSEASRSNLGGGGGHHPRPTHSHQGQRLAPKLSRLQAAFEARRVEVQRSPIGTDPEQVLVIETVGSVEDFARAVARIEGFEWMGELEIDEILPEPDYIEGEETPEPQRGRLYMVMSDHQALNELLSLWRRFSNDSNMDFKRGEFRGYGKFKDVFMCLNDIRRWDAQDRLADTGVLDAWREDLQYSPDRSIRFEAELWYRASSPRRREAESTLGALLEDLGGRLVGQCVIDDIAYHSVLAEIPAQAAQEIIEHPVVALTQCDNVMFFRPVGQVATGREPSEGELSEYPSADEAMPSGDPIVALLDGMPIENHRLLGGRLLVDDPADWAADYPARERWHGTSMASLIVHGDLSDGGPPMSRPLYVRPVMRPNSADWRSPREEHIPDDVLLVDHIHQAVRRLFETDGDQAPVAPTVRIVNFSIGDPERQFTHTMSPLARLLDWLSQKYNILFVVSGGNHFARDIDTGLTREQVRDLNDSELESLIINKLYGDAIHRRVLSPAESINAVTVGASHHDSSTVVHIDGVLDPFRRGLPSPVSPFGGGYRRSIKPDFIFPGGRVLLTEPIPVGGTVKLRVRPRKIAPGNRTAAPGVAAGDYGKTAFSCGTSNSAALTSRTAANYHDVLSLLLQEQAAELDTGPFVVPLLKAMLVHGCSWGDAADCLGEVFDSTIDANQMRKWIARWNGYGVPDTGKALECTVERATLLGFGRLSDEDAHVFALPLPPSLGASLERRRLTVTLAWISPVAPRTQRYRSCHLWFKIDDMLALTRCEADWQAARRGTVQHEIFEGERAVPIGEEESLAIKVNCRKDASEFDEPVAYGLVVSLEVAEGVGLPIYDEVRTRIAPAVEIRPQEGR